MSEFEDKNLNLKQLSNELTHTTNVQNVEQERNAIGKSRLLLKNENKQTNKFSV